MEVLSLLARAATGAAYLQSVTVGAAQALSLVLL
jgi:hypothetical protein